MTGRRGGRGLRRTGLTALVGTLALLALSGPGTAHGGSLRFSATTPAVPFWLVSLTGGGVIGVSFLFTALLTDHALIRDVADRKRALPSVTPGRVVGWAAVGLLALLLAVGLVGPADPTSNVALLGVWVGWWAGYTASVYLVGNSWPAVNPWRRLATLLPDRGRDVDPTTATRLSVGGLLALVYLEVLSPFSDDPRLLVAGILAYSAVTLVGAALVGEDWFDRIDPISRVFRLYGRLAPVQRTDGGLRVTLPGAALTRPDDGDAARRAGDATFVVALVWVTTFDGLVSTAAWAGFARAVVGAGVPAHAVYVATLLVGFGLFLGAYRAAARLSRRTADTYVAVSEIRTRFAPSLVPIAAGYHLAHYLGYFLTFAPTVAVLATDPLSPPANPPALVLPAWFGTVGLVTIVAGHILAVGVAHVVAFETFTGRLQPLRSQYPFIVVMVAYTMTSLWLVAQPAGTPPFV